MSLLKKVHVSHTKVVSYDLLSFPTKVVVGSAVVSLMLCLMSQHPWPNLIIMLKPSNITLT